MFDVITVGSATVDAFAETEKKYIKKGSYSYPVGSKIKVNSLHFDTGGSAVNAAISFSRLGMKTACICKIGEGHNGDRVLATLKGEKVDSSMIHRSPTKTGFSVILDAKEHDRTILAFKGSNDEIRERDIKISRIKTNYLYSSTMMGKSFSTLKMLFSFAQKNNIKTALSASTYFVRWGKTRLKPVLSKTDILIYNREEAEILTKKKKIKDLLIKSQKLLKKDGIAVITDGANGAHACDGKYIYKIASHKIKIKETTGAGDAFASTFVAMLAKGKDIYFAMKAAILNSESVITHIGAKNKLLKWSELLTQLKNCKSKVIIKQIK